MSIAFSFSVACYLSSSLVIEIKEGTCCRYEGETTGGDDGSVFDRSVGHVIKFEKNKEMRLFDTE